MRRDQKREFERAALPLLDNVYRAAVALCSDSARAEDLTQATFLKAFESFGLFRAGTNCKAWLLRILRNTWIDQLRHTQIAGTQVSLDEELLPAAPQDAGAATAPSADESIAKAYLIQANPAEILEKFGDTQIIRALQQLPEDQRLAVYLVDVEGLTLEEAAEICDAPTGTIKSRASRARAALREKLESLARDLGLAGGGR